MRHSSPAWVNLPSIIQLDPITSADLPAQPENISTKHTLLVFKPTEPGSKRRHIPLGHVEGSVDDGLVIFFSGLLGREKTL